MDDRTVMVPAALATVAATLSVGAAGIHFAVIEDHLARDLGFGMFFIALARFQAIWAQTYLLCRTTLVAGIGILVMPW